MFSGSVDAGFVLALSFHHRDLEPDCVGASTREAYVWDENTFARLCVENVRGAYMQGGAYLRDTMVFAFWAFHAIHIRIPGEPGNEAIMLVILKAIHTGVGWVWLVRLLAYMLL